MRPHAIMNLELASICNLACDYCPASQVGEHRFAGLMSEEVFAGALTWFDQLTREGTQRELNLFGVGESTLHPRLCEFVSRLREVSPRGILHLNTNGIVLAADPSLARDLKEAGITGVHVTDHEARTTVAAMRALNDARVPHSINRDFVTGPNNWAGQIEWVPEVSYKLTCAWLARGDVAIQADGGVSQCCIDAFGTSVEANVMTHRPEQVELGPFSLCDGCHHDRI